MRSLAALATTCTHSHTGRNARARRLRVSTVARAKLEPREEEREEEREGRRGRARTRHSPRFRAFSLSSTRKRPDRLQRRLFVRRSPVGTGLPCGVVKYNRGELEQDARWCAFLCMNADARNTTQRR